MPASRIIITGKNKDFPNTIRLPVGVGLDGCAITAPVRVRSNQYACRTCQGWGEILHSPVNPSERDYYTRCYDCDGEGIVTVVAA